jgi:peptide chain release factor 3
MNTVNEVRKERLKRRTFAIISHPDAGKTTLTEKLLLYSGMVRTAGMVRGRKGSRSTSSDWMAMEQERGISITASAMQFPYKDSLINVLDTPGHQDFCEDTYRTLAAADCAIMVIDASKGVETQTRKLFEVCRLRKIPVITFMNKLDLPARDRFELLEEVEDVLGINTAPITWPIGAGKNFSGIVDLATNEVFLFQRGSKGGAEKVAVSNLIWDEWSRTNIEESKEVTEELELVKGAGNKYSHKEFLAGQQSPVFFGSALTNFGIEHFFDEFIKIAPPPRSYNALDAMKNEIKIDPDVTPFSGFIFKIQANMNPKHRDSMVFIRVCSGNFARDMTVVHQATKKKIRLSRSYAMVANERDTVNDGYPGDIVGVINPGFFNIGDTVSLEGDFSYPPIPQFPPEVVCRIRPLDVMRMKSFQKGIAQLCSEGAVQLLRAYNDPDGTPLVAAVGTLQFDVLQHRLKHEYQVETVQEQLPHKYSFYLEGNPADLKLTQTAYLTLTAENKVVVLLSNEWESRYIAEQNPKHKLLTFF